MSNQPPGRKRLWARTEPRRRPGTRERKPQGKGREEERDFRAGYQIFWRRPEWQTVDPPQARNVGNGFAGAPPREPSARRARMSRIDRFFGVSDEPDALATKNGAKQ